MRLTYMLSPTTPYVTHIQASNILSENLKRDDRINPLFNLSILSLGMEITNERENILNQLSDGPVKELYSKPEIRQIFLRILGGLYSTHHEFFMSVMNTIKTELVLISCWTIHSIPLISHLLNNGKRIVMGGSFCNSYPIDFIRTTLRESGVKEHNMKNVIVVKGYVGVNTDLYEIITNWVDVEIPETDYIDMWIGSGDFIKNHLNILNKCRGTTDDISYSVTFNNNCWYNKCKFCKLRDEEQPDFIRNIDADMLYEHLVENLITYKTKKILINDNYFIFDDKNRYVLKRLRQDGYKVQVLSGILLLNSKQHLHDLNDCVDVVSVGMESTIDFCLDYITKGYTWDVIKRSLDNVEKYLDRDKYLRYLIIIDLVTRRKDDIVKNYENLAYMKNRLASSGFNQVGFSFTPLQLFPSVGMLEDTEYLKIKNGDSVSGMWYVYKQLQKVGVDVSLPQNLMMPFERYDEDGNILLSDFEYISKESISNLF